MIMLSLIPILPFEHQKQLYDLGLVFQPPLLFLKICVKTLNAVRIIVEYRVFYVGLNVLCNDSVETGLLTIFDTFIVI